MSQNSPTTVSSPAPALASHFLSLLPNSTLLASSALLPLRSVPLPPTPAPASAPATTSSKKSSTTPAPPKLKAILPMPTPGCFLPAHLTTLLQPKPQVDPKPPRKVAIKTETVSIDGCVFNNRGYEICGHLNQHNKPCQRIGKCPFHSHIKKESPESAEPVIVETEKKEKPAPPMQKTPYKQGWTKEEHMRFLNGLHVHGKGAWKEIANVVGTRTPTQIQSHAQKYFLRQQQKIKNKRSIHDTSLEDVYSDQPMRIVSPSTSPSPTPSPLSSPVKNGAVPASNLFLSSLPGFLPFPFADALPIMYPPIYQIPYQFLPNTMPKYMNLPEGMPVGYLTPFGFSSDLTEVYKTMSTTSTTSPNTAYLTTDIRGESIEDIQVSEADSLQSPPGYISQLMISALPEDDDSKDFDDIMDLRNCKRSFEMLFDEQPPSNSRPEKLLKLATTDISSYINL